MDKTHAVYDTSRKAHLRDPVAANAFAKCDSAIVAKMRWHFYVISQTLTVSGVTSSGREVRRFPYAARAGFVGEEVGEGAIGDPRLTIPPSGTAGS